MTHTQLTEMFPGITKREVVNALVLKNPELFEGMLVRNSGSWYESFTVSDLLMICANFRVNPDSEEYRFRTELGLLSLPDFMIPLIPKTTSIL